jgi:hypothetical protein
MWKTCYFYAKPVRRDPPPDRYYYSQSVPLHSYAQTSLASANQYYSGPRIIGSR